MRRLRSSTLVQFTVRCEVNVAGAIVSAKLVLPSDISCEEFRSLVWAEFLAVVAGHGIDTVFIPTQDLSEYALSVAGRPDVVLQMGAPLKPQLPKPCQLMLVLGDRWVSRTNLSSLEDTGRHMLQVQEDEEVHTLCADMLEGIRVAEQEEEARRQLQERSAVLEKQSLAAVQLLLQEEEREMRQFQRLIELTTNYAQCAAQLSGDLAKLAQTKRVMILQARTVFSTAQLCRESYKRGLETAAMSADLKVDASQLYDTRMHHRHRFELDTVYETSVLRQQYRAHRAADMQQNKAETTRPVTLAADPGHYRKGLVCSTQSLREMVASQKE